MARERERARERVRTGAPEPGLRGKEALAAAAVLVFLAQLLLAQLTLILTGCLLAASRASRWRPAWLAVPAAAGLIWVAAIGPGRAMAGFTAGAAQLARFLAGPGGSLGRVLASPAGAFGGWRQWLPRQLPVALMCAAAETVLLSLPGRRRRAYRPGLFSAARRRYAGWLAARGQTVTGAGACLGVSESTGARICVSWREVSHGMLLAGREAAALADSGMAVAAAAIQRRQAVIVIDLTGSRTLGTAIPAADRSAGAPVRRFGSSECGYDPFRAAAPDRACALALAMVDWDGAGAGQRQFCGDYLAAVAQLFAAGEGSVAGLDQLISALDPGTLRSLVRRPGALAAGPGLAAGQGLAAQVAELTDRAAADPAPVQRLAAQLAGLRRSALGRCLGPGAGHPGISDLGSSDPGISDPGISDPEISIRQVLRRREIALFSLDGRVHGRSAAMIARLATADLTAVLGERAELAAPADCLAWLHGCEAADRRLLGRLLELGPLAGTTVLLSTSVPAVAVALAPRAGVVLLRGPIPAELAGLPELARLAGTTRPAGHASVVGVAGMAGPHDMDWLAGPPGQSAPGAWQQHGVGGRPRRSDDLSMLVRFPEPERQVHGRALEVRPPAAKPVAGHGLRRQLPGSRAVLAGLRAAGRR